MPVRRQVTRVLSRNPAG